MKVKQGFLPAERRAISLLASLYAVRMLGLFMVLPVFFVQGESLGGATPELLGLAIGAYGLSQACLQVPFGMLSDRFGRKPLIVAGLLVFIAGSMVAAMSVTIYGVILGRLLQGAGAIASVLMAMVSDLTREEQRTKAMATVGMTIGISFAVAMVVGPVVSVRVGLSGLFWLTVGLAVVGLFLVSRLPSAVIRKRHRDTMLVTNSISQVFANKQLMRLNFGIFALHMVMTALFVAAPKALVTEFQVDPGYHGYYYLAVIFLAFVCMIPLIVIGESRRRVAKVFQLVVLLLTGSLVLEIWATTQFSLFTILLFLFFVAFNYLEATLPSLVSKVASAGMRGTAMGLYSSSQFLGAFSGGTLAGLVYAEGGLVYVYGLCAGIGVAWCLVNLGMSEPPYTTSFVLPLRAFKQDDAEQIGNDLSLIAGVQDVTLVVEENLAYLKIDRKNLDEDELFNYPLAVRSEG
jgi:MFS family permease